MNLLFFHSKTLVTRELADAIKRRGGLRLISVQIPPDPPAERAENIFETFAAHTPAIVLSINDAGYDREGRMQELLLDSGSYIVNWYHDYPFFEHEFYNRCLALSDRRIDFVSEKSYVHLMTSRGCNAAYLPLATDPAFFNRREPRRFERDIAFVGNSSLELMDALITDDAAAAIERFGPLLLRLKQAYYRDCTISVRELLQRGVGEWEKQIALPADRFVFLMEWMVGFQYRRDFIAAIAKRYGRAFVVFGDPYWKRYVRDSTVTAEACYYDNLCHYYRTTKINLNVNRIQIRSSFTQRHFDCKASGAFLLTDKRACNPEVFVTEGPDREIVEYESLAQCHELIRYYLTHEDERERIAQAGIDNILKNHTYDNRVEEILRTAGKTWGI